MKRIVITGARGRIGRRLVEVLHQQGVETIGFVRGPAVTKEEAAVDLADPRAFRAALRSTRPSVVVHLAGRSPSALASDREAVNVGTLASLAASSTDLERIVFASSAAVYGDELRVPAAETSPINPLSAYADSKARAESLLERGSCATIALRIFNVYGPGFDDSLVARLLDATVDSPAHLRGLESFVRDYVHVSDVVVALVRACTADLPSSHMVVNVGSGIPMSNLGLLEALAGEARHYVVTEGPRSYSVAETARAREVLNFAAGILLDPESARRY